MGPINIFNWKWDFPMYSTILKPWMHICRIHWNPLKNLQNPWESCSGNLCKTQAPQRPTLIYIYIYIYIYMHVADGKGDFTHTHTHLYNLRYYICTYQTPFRGIARNHGWGATCESPPAYLEKHQPTFHTSIGMSIFKSITKGILCSVGWSIH